MTAESPERRQESPVRRGSGASREITRPQDKTPQRCRRIGKRGNEMQELEFVIEYPDTRQGKTEWSKRYGLNAYWAGKHWAERKRDAEYWHWLTRDELHGLPGEIPHFTRPVEVEFYHNDRLDADNHAAIGKMILDALKGEVVEDDDRRHVRSVKHGFWDGDGIRVLIREVKQDAE